MQEKNKYLIILNPASGTTSKRRILPVICRKLDKLSIPYDIVGTKYPGHATELAAEAAAQGRPAVLACGGDGTVNEVAKGLLGSNTVLGIIPAGSGNGLARHLGIPIDVSLALDVITSQNVIISDYGTANGRPFFCTFGVGFDAAISERCARQKRRGLFMYLHTMLNECVKFKPEQYVIETKGRIITERAFLVVCCNASQYGNNAFIAPEASVTDGLLDITIVHSDDLLSRAVVGADIVSGNIGKGALSEIIRTDSATIIRKTPGLAHIDGEAMTMPETIKIQCHSGQLRIFAASDSTRFVPFITPSKLFFRDIFYTIKGLIVKNR